MGEEAGATAQGDVETTKQAATYYGRPYRTREEWNGGWGTTQEYYATSIPTNVDRLQGWGLPVVVYDDAANCSANAGNVWVKMTPDGDWQYLGYYSDFSAGLYGDGPNHFFTMNKPQQLTTPYIGDPCNWRATWGTGGPGWSVMYSSNYGQ